MNTTSTVRMIFTYEEDNRTHYTEAFKGNDPEDIAREVYGSDIFISVEPGTPRPTPVVRNGAGEELARIPLIQFTYETQAAEWWINHPLRTTQGETA